MTVARYLERKGLMEDCITWLQRHYPKVNLGKVLVFILFCHQESLTASGKPHHQSLQAKLDKTRMRQVCFCKIKIPFNIKKPWKAKEEKNVRSFCLGIQRQGKLLATGTIVLSLWVSLFVKMHAIWCKYFNCNVLGELAFLENKK